MKLAATRSWIFYAIGLASERSMASSEAVERAADAINHALPTHNEMTSSTGWLESLGLIKIDNNQYRLTATGRQLLAAASQGVNTTRGVWKNLEHSFAQQEN